MVQLQIFVNGLICKQHVNERELPNILWNQAGNLFLLEAVWMDCAEFTILPK